MKNISRRDILKSGAALLLGALAPRVIHGEPKGLNQNNYPNVIVIVFDTMSARNLSLYGYRRATTPNLERFARRATVFHNHISGGNYTTPGTATLLTGAYPWTHRAINQGGLVLRRLTSQSIFSAFHPTHNSFAFTQNLWADYLINQFALDVDTHLLPGSFSLADKSTGALFPNDLNAASRSLDDFLFQSGERPGSLIFGPLEEQLFAHAVARAGDIGYSRGLPHDVTNPKYFRLEDVFRGVGAQLTSSTEPFFSYVHLYAPHEPYRPRAEFENIFRDNWRPAAKPTSRFTDGSSELNLVTRRTNYDEYVANVDADFGKLMDTLEDARVFEKSIVVVTSDHGQLFERGIHGHTTPTLYDPVIHVPLLISVPGQAKRVDQYAFTSSIDVIPTLLHLSNLLIPSWCRGMLLPGLGGQDLPGRSLFAVEAKSSSAFARLSKFTIAMHKDNYKMIYYSGYSSENWFELYDVRDDPEELKDLYPSSPALVSSMRDELLTALDEANQDLLENK